MLMFFSNKGMDKSNLPKTQYRRSHKRLKTFRCSEQNKRTLNEISHTCREKTSNLKRLGVSAMCGSSHACNPGALRRLKQLPQARGQPVPHNESMSVEASEQHPIVRTIKPAASAAVDRKTSRNTLSAA